MRLAVYLVTILLGQTRIGRRWFDLLPIALITWLAAHSQMDADAQQYESAYTELDSYFLFHDYGIGFQLLLRAGNALGIDFYTFKTITIFVVLLMYEYVLTRLTKDSATVWSLLLIYPVLVSIVQLRQTIALAFAMMGLMFLITQRWRGVPWMIAFTLIGSTMHITCIAYLFMIFCLLGSRRTLTITCSLIAIFGVILSQSFLNKILQLIPQNKVGYFYNNNISFYTKAALIILVVANVIIVNIACRSVERSGFADPTALDHMQMISRICIVFLCFIPLVIEGTDFMRFDRVILVYVFTAISIALTANHQMYTQRKISIYMQRQYVAQEVLIRTGAILFSSILAYLLIAKNDMDGVIVPLLFS